MGGLLTGFWTLAVLSASYTTWPSPTDYLRALELGGLSVSEDTALVTPEERETKALSLLEEERQALRDDRVEHAVRHVAGPENYS